MKDDFFILNIFLNPSHKISRYTKEFSKKKFLETSLVQDAVIRQFEIIGEATKKLSPEFREEHDHIPWAKIAGMRDKLIHDYLDVDLALVWATAKTNVPELKRQIKKLLK
jgi:uncharacterized protein with HEPN domain